MKDGSSRRKKILGLIGVVILALGAFSVVAFGARMLAGHFAGNSQQMAIAAVEPETGELKFNALTGYTVICLATVKLSSARTFIAHPVISTTTAIVASSWAPSSVA